MELFLSIVAGVALSYLIGWLAPWILIGYCALRHAGSEPDESRRE